MILKGLSGRSYQLAEKPFSSGGEGDIYGIAGMAGGVVKVYHADRITRELEEKLQVMSARMPSRGILSQIAWPLDVVYGLNGAFQGFVMSRLDITDELGAVYAYPPKKNISYKAKVIIAQNICAVISEIHRAGFVFGDFNPKNIGIDLNTCRVAFLDTDSYHIVDGNRVYRCKVCLDGYVAPELLKKCEPYKTDAYARTPLPTFTRETDNFALAIHIFRLLMNGYTPFNGIPENQSASTASPGTGNQAIKRDNYCFKPGNKPQSAAVPPLSVLPREIGELFTRAFIHGRTDPGRRPSAVEWHRALLNYEASLVSCPNNPAHLYQRGLPSCPWCEADARYTALLAGPAVPAALHLPQKSFSGAVVPVSPPPAPAPTFTPPVQPPVSAGYGSAGSGSSGYSGSPGGHGVSGGGTAYAPSRPSGGSARRSSRGGRRRSGKLRAAAVLLIAVLAAGACMAFVMDQRNRYTQAESLLDAGSYSEAAAAFDELGGYSDAEDRTEEAMYQEAEALMEAGKYEEAAAAFEELGSRSDAEERALDAKYKMAEALLGAGDKPAAAMTFGALGDYQDARARSFAVWDEIAVRETISGGNTHAVALRADGTVAAAGGNSNGECDVGAWTDITAVSAGTFHTVGLRSDGTVVAVGKNEYGECDVGSWTDIVAVDAGGADTVGLKSDGTVVVAGYKQGKTDGWRDITAVSADDDIVGLRSDGTVVGIKNQSVESWTDITAISSGGLHTIGLRSNGTVVTVGGNYYGELSVEEWENIAALSTASSHTVGLRADGSLVAAGGNYGEHDDVETWRDIVAISAGTTFTLGLRPDGTVVYEGRNRMDVSGWTGIKVPGK